MTLQRKHALQKSGLAALGDDAHITAVQPHGLLVACDPETLAITHVSANVEAFLDIAPAAMFGRSVAEYVDPAYADTIRAFARRGGRGTGTFSPVVLRGARGEIGGWRAACHRSGAAVVVEAAPVSYGSSFADRFLFDAASALGSIGDNSGVSAAAAAIARTLRDLSGYHHVVVLRFDDRGHGEVIAESRAAAARPSLAGFRLLAEEMPAAARARAIRSPIRMIHDLAAAPTPVLAAGEAGTASLDLSAAILRAPSPAAVDILTRLGVRGSAQMSIAFSKRLWGFVFFLHRAPRRLSTPYRAAFQLMAEAIAVRLAAAETLDREREMARRRRALAAFRRALERETVDDVAAVLRRHGKSLLRIVGADGLWCHLPEADFGIGQTPAGDLGRRLTALCRMRSSNGLFATDHVAGLDAGYAAAAATASGALFAALPRTRGALLFLRGEAALPAENGRSRFLAERDAQWRRARARHSAPWSAPDLAVVPDIAEAVDALAPRLAERRGMRRVRENEAKLQAILDATQDGLIVIDGDGTILDFSRGAARLFGWSMAEIVGQGATALVAESARDDFRAAIANATLDLRPRLIGGDGKLAGLRKDGVTFPLEMTLASIVLGGETMFVGALRDVTERLNFAERDRFWFAYSSIGYSVFDARTNRRLRVNPALCALLGYTEAELLAMPMYGMAIPEEVRPAHAWQERVLAGSDEIYRNIQRHIRRDGRHVWVRITASPIRYAGSNAIHIVTEVVDITDLIEGETKLRAALARAEAASTAKSQFLATMSHELRTPLNAIIGMSEMVTAEVMGPIGNERYREYLHDIHKAGRHLLDLVTDVLDTSRIEAGGYRLAPEMLRVEEVIDETHRIVSALAAQRGVVIDRRIAPDLPVLRADRRALKQVLINVVSNAVKFTDEKGLVAIRAAIDAGSAGVEIVVADNGRGIAAEHLPHVTEPFYRASDAYTTGPASGAGLGLSIAHGLVQAHGGTLEIDSQVGRGTTVTLRLPPAAVVA